MSDAARNQAIADVARQILAEVAPQELPLFRPLSQAYFKDPGKALKGGGGADRMLGFGGAATATLLTPLILQSTQLALDSLAGRFLDHLNSELARLDSWLTDLRARPTAETAAAADLSTTEDPSAVPPEVIDQVQQIVAQQLRQLKCSPQQADLLASKVSAALAGGKLAQEMLAQEVQIRSQVCELKIEINELRKAQEVDRIVNSDYFAQICQRASDLRRQTSQRQV